MCCDSMACCAPVAKCGRSSCGGGLCSCSGADIAVMLSSGAISAGIEVLYELCFPHTGNDWITKSLLSSATSAAATFLIGMAIYSTKCGRREGDGDGCLFLLGLTLSQLMAGGVSFGIGVGVDALCETYIQNHESSNVVNAVVSPVLISVARGFFKTASTGAVGFFRRFCCGSSVDDLAKPGIAQVDEREVESLLDQASSESPRPGTIN